MLVADDSAAIHVIFRQVVGRSALPLELIETDNGRECMDLLRAGNIGLAFIDVYMPRMSGLEALTHARFVDSKTFVTLMSGFPDDRCIALARELNAYEFLTKPFRFRDVEAIIKTFERVHRPMRVLIVNEQETVRSLIRRVLARSIFRLQIEEASGSEVARALDGGPQFDVIFVDFNLASRQPLDQVRRLRERSRETRIVIVASHHNEHREREAMALGATAVLHEPIYPMAVDALIHRMFGLRSPTLAITKPGVLRDFDVTIVGRTIAVAHRESGQRFQYVWFRDSPHLRAAEATSDPSGLPPAIRAQAEKAALLELKTARLVS
jgi:DNA-binding NtrC family response regulator